MPCDEWFPDEYKVKAVNWHYPEGPGIIKSYDFLSSTGTYGNGLMNRVRQSVGLPTPPEPRPITNPQIIAEIRDLKRKVEQIGDDQYILAKKIEQIKEDKIVEFQNNDVYEINKRIERLEDKVALIVSNLANNRIVGFLFGKLWQT
jgi:hypothetical protein